MTTESRGFEPLHICCQSCPIVWTLNFIPWGFPVSEVRCMYTSTKFELQHGLLPKPHFPPPVLHSVYIRGSRVQDDIMHSYVGPISFVHLSVYDVNN